MCANRHEYDPRDHGQMVVCGIDFGAWEGVLGDGSEDPGDGSEGPGWI